MDCLYNIHTRRNQTFTRDWKEQVVLLTLHFNCSRHHFPSCPAFVGAFILSFGLRAMPTSIEPTKRVRCASSDLGVGMRKLCNIVSISVLQHGYKTLKFI
jgi:hypothetical protein